MTNKLFLIKKLYLFIIFQFFIINQSYSEIIKKFNIEGNNRISDETIIMFSNLKSGEKINKTKLNDALKELYYTDYFKDVKIFQDNEIINIQVIENPIIQKIIINGVKDNKLNDIVNEVTSKVLKYPLIESKISDQVKLLKNILKSYGYYSVELEAVVDTNENNTVNLTYNFDLGEIAKIKKIKFIGEKIFSDGTLRNIIISEEDKFWKFITRNKFLDSNRVKADVSRLENYYKNRGFYNINIKSTFAIINEKNQFELIFNIDAGNKFFFNEIKLNNSNDIEVGNISIFEERLKNLEGERYSKKKIDDLISEINVYTLRNDFVFIDANFTEVILKDNKINIIINFEDIEKTYVERINILGNFITDEKVIRNLLIVDEGDPFNKILFEKSIQNIKAQNIFKNVNYQIQDNNNNMKNIDLTVEEKATGEIFAGAGTGTTGSSITAGIKENNYLGLGIKLDTNINITEDSIKGKFSVLNPNYNNSDKSIRTVLESSSDDFMSTSGYRTSRTGFTIGTEFEQMNDLFINIELSNFYEDLETSSSASSIVKNQEGNYFENLISYALI